MIVDFQHHYTPPELGMSAETVTGRVDKNGTPTGFMNPLLSDLPEHLRAMDAVGIDAAVLSSAPGWDQPDIATAKLINDCLYKAQTDHPGRFIGLAHVPSMNPDEAIPELKRCAVDLNFPGVAISARQNGEPLDSEHLRPFWKTVADLGLYVFVHPKSQLPPEQLQLIGWMHMDADDLARMLGWEFGLMIAATRVINSGLLDDFPSLRIQFGHFAGGIGRYIGRIRGFQQRAAWATADNPKHGRHPAKPFDHYLNNRVFYDCAGWAGPAHVAESGGDWVRSGLSEVSVSQTVFATDYPQAVRDDEQIRTYIQAVRALGPDARAVLEGANVHKLIPDIRERLQKRAAGSRGAKPD